MSAFEQLISQLLATKKKLDQNLKNLKAQAADIDEWYAPRNEFDRWKKTEVGKTWKRETHRKQKEKCAVCKRDIALIGSHIDHIKPLVHFPEFAVDPKNLRILCPDCNVQKGSQSSE